MDGGEAQIRMEHEEVPIPGHTSLVFHMHCSYQARWFVLRELLPCTLFLDRREQTCNPAVHEGVRPGHMK